MTPVKITAFTACAAIAIMAIAYVAYLVAMWRQVQSDRAARDEKIDGLLDRVPKAAGTE